MASKKVTIDLVLFFYKEECGHCKPFLPLVYKLKQSGKIKIEAILGEENKSLSKKYDVEYYPTLVFIEKDNGKSRKLIGKSKIAHFFNTIIKPKSNE